MDFLPEVMLKTPTSPFVRTHCTQVPLDHSQLEAQFTESSKGDKAEKVSERQESKTGVATHGALPSWQVQ